MSITAKTYGVSSRKCDLRRYENVFNAPKQNRDRSYVPMSFAEYYRYIQVKLSTRCITNLTDEMKLSQPAVQFINEAGFATAFMVDYDHLKPDNLWEILGICEKSGTECFIHTSSSSTLKKPRIHILFPLQEPVPAELIHREYKRVISELGLPSDWDQATGSGKRNWFLPTYHISGILAWHYPNAKRLHVQETARSKAPESSELAVTVNKSTSKAITEGETKKAAKSVKKFDPVLVQEMQEVLEKEFAGPAFEWLKDNFLEGVEIHKVDLNGGDGKVNVTYWCPECLRRGRRKQAWAVMSIGTGKVHGECYSAKCNYGLHWKPAKNTAKEMEADFVDVETDSNSVDDGDSDSICYDAVDQARYVSSLCRRFKLFNIKNVARTWWYLDRSRIWDSDTVARTIAFVLGKSWKEVKNLIWKRTGTELDWRFDLGPCTRELTHEVVVALQTLQNRHIIKSERLHLVSGKNHDHSSYFVAPVNGTPLDRKRWSFPSITVNEVTCGDRYDPWNSSISFHVLRGLGYLSLSPRDLHQRLRKLPPVVIAEPPTTGNEDDRLLFRQRVHMALVRGCHVIVTAGSGNHAARDVAREFGLDRNAEIGRRRLQNLLPMPEAPFRPLVEGTEVVLKAKAA